MKKQLLALMLAALLCFVCTACSASAEVSSAEPEQTSSASESAPESSAASSASEAEMSSSEAELSASEAAEPQGGGTIAIKKPSEPDLSDYTEEELAELRYEEAYNRISEQYSASADALSAQVDALIPQEYKSFYDYNCDVWPNISEDESGSLCFAGYNISVTLPGPADAAGAQARAAEIHQLLADNGIVGFDYQYHLRHSDAGNRTFLSDAPETAPAPFSKSAPVI